MEILPLPSPSSSMKPSFGTTTYLPKTRKSSKVSRMGIEYDFYPNFICWKPKLKWNSTKSDSSPPCPNWCILIARNIPTSGLPNSGKSPSETLKQPSLTYKFTPSQSPCQTPWEEKLNTRNNSISYWHKLITSPPTLPIGIQWIALKLVLDQTPLNYPSSSSPPQLYIPTYLNSVFVESTCAGAIIDPTLLPRHPTLNCGNLLRTLSPEEDYITCVTAALLNLAH